MHHCEKQSDLNQTSFSRDRIITSVPINQCNKEAHEKGRSVRAAAQTSDALRAIYTNADIVFDRSLVDVDVVISIA